MDPIDAEAFADPSFAFLAARAYEVAVELRGDRVYSGPSIGYPMRRAVGHCRLCGRSGKLTYEHIPPRSAGNSKPRRFISAFEILRSSNVSVFPKRGSKIQQRGSGVYVLCDECNRLLSHRGYVEEYREFVWAAATAMGEFGGGLPDNEVFPQDVHLQVERLSPGLIIRQALAMLICASGSAQLTSVFPQLRECVLDMKPVDLPIGMSLHLGLVAGPRGRLCYPVVAIDRDARTWEVVMEATFAPFSWLLRVSDSPPNMSLADVSGWTSLPPNEVRSIDVPTQVGFVFGPMPLDYRHDSDFPPGSSP